MKVLILASPRSGSTILIRSLSKHLKLYPYGEPFNYGLNRPKIEYPLNLSKNSIVKTLVYQVPESYTNNEVDFYDEFKDNFDKVILLTRKTLQETYESYAYNYFYHPDGNWPFKYWYKEVPFNDKLFTAVERDYNKILDYSKRWDIPVTLYEDLYSGNKNRILQCFKSWNLDLNFDEMFKYITPANKYRKEGKPDNFI